MYISPLTESTRMGYFKSDKQFQSIILLKNCILFTFLCSFRHQIKLFSISQFWGNLDSIQKSFITMTTCHTANGPINDILCRTHLD